MDLRDGVGVTATPTRWHSLRKRASRESAGDRPAERARRDDRAGDRSRTLRRNRSRERAQIQPDHHQRGHTPRDHERQPAEIKYATPDRPPRLRDSVAGPARAGRQPSSG